MCVCMNVCMYLCMYVCVVHVCMDIIYVCVRVCMHVCTDGGSIGSIPLPHDPEFDDLDFLDGGFTPVATDEPLTVSSASPLPPPDDERSLKRIKAPTYVEVHEPATDSTEELSKATLGVAKVLERDQNVRCARYVWSCVF